MEYGAALREMWVACGNLGDDCLDGFRLASDEERRAAAMMVQQGANSYDVAIGFASRQDTTRPAAIDPWVWRYARQLQALANQAAADAKQFGVETERWLAMLPPRDKIRFFTFLHLERMTPEQRFLQSQLPAVTDEPTRPALHIIHLEGGEPTEEAAWNMCNDEAFALGEEIYARWTGAPSVTRAECVEAVVQGENPGDVVRRMFDC